MKIDPATGKAFDLADKVADTWFIQDYLGHLNIQHNDIYTSNPISRW